LLVLTLVQEARRIAKEFEEYPLLHWRVLFTEIIDQLQDYDGEEEEDFEIDQKDETKKKANLKKSKALEPTLNLTLEGKEMIIEYTNIKEITLKYYVLIRKFFSPEHHSSCKIQKIWPIPSQ
jgi:hypothetical protein